MIPLFQLNISGEVLGYFILEYVIWIGSFLFVLLLIVALMYGKLYNCTVNCTIVL